MEIWDIYDINRQLTGRTVVRGVELPEGQYHLDVNICVFNSRNQMLIQQRQTSKETWPGYWEVSASGSVVSGETSQAGAQRELYEEIGINADLSNYRPYLTVNTNNAIQDFYIIEDNNIRLDELKLQESEVKQVRWADEAEILKMIDADEFIPLHRPLISLLFSMHEYGKIGTLRLKQQGDRYGIF